MKSVTIYTTPTCGFCHMAKEYLKTKKIDYEDIDVSKDLDGMNWVVNHTGQMGVPVIKIDDDIIIGFDRPAIDELLKEI